MVKAVAYLRVSTDGQDTESQMYQVKEFAKHNEYNIEYEITDWFIDPAESGAKEDRPELIRLREWVTNNEYGTVIMPDNDRLARDNWLFHMVNHEFKEYSITPRFLNFMPTGNQAYDDYNLANLVNNSQLERYKIFVRFETGRQRKISENKKAWGGVPKYGYKLRIIPLSRDRNDYYLEIDEEEAKNVRLIYKFFLSGLVVIQEICREMAKKGLKTRRGSIKWAPTTVRNILKDSTYYGEYHYGKTKTIGAGSRKREVLRPLEEQKIVQVPAIINKEDFDRVQGIFASYKARKNPKQNNKDKNLLTGVIRCGKCHYRYTGWRRSSTKIEDKWFYYRCNSINQYDPENKSPSCGNPPIMGYQTENIVWEELQKLIIRVAIKKENIWKDTKKDDLEKYKMELSEEFSKINKAISKNSDQQKELMNFIGVFSKEQITNKQKELTQQEKDLETQLKEVISKSVLLTYNEGNESDIPLPDIDALENPSFERKRVLILKYIKEVIVLPSKPTKILIVFNIPIKPVESVVTTNKDSAAPS